MQQPGAMFPVMPSFPPNNITTEQIQKKNMRQTKLIAYEIRDVIEANTSEKYLDENKKLILAILDNQNLGKLAECAQFQAQLQKNLMYLAAIADAQPQTPTMPTQMSPHPAMQQGGFYMQQHPMAQQQGIFPPRGPPFNSPHTLQDLQATSSQGQMGLRPNNGHNDNIGASNSGLNDMLGGGGSISKQQDKAGSDAQGGNGDGEEAQ